MSVYADNMFKSASWGKWAGGGHLVAETVDELVAFAVGIGLKAEWLQGTKDNRPHPHFDLTRTKLREAISAGATPTDAREATRIAYVCGGNPPPWYAEPKEADRDA